MDNNLLSQADIDALVNNMTASSPPKPRAAQPPSPNPASVPPPQPAQAVPPPPNPVPQAQGPTNFTMKKMVLELNETLQFEYGMRARMNDPKSSFLCWREFFNVADDYEFYIETCGIGYYVLKYQSELNKSILKKYAKEIEWEGYSCLVCNTQNFINTTFMLNEYDKYELKIVYSIDMNGKYCVNICSTNPEIDCSKIAVKYGGGGHVGSAGFITNELPF